MLISFPSFQKTFITNRTGRDTFAGSAGNGGPCHSLRPCSSGGRVRPRSPCGREGLRPVTAITAGDQS